MQILIINLAKSLERRRFQQQQFAELAMECEFLSAVSVADISEQDYQAQGFGWQRPLRKVELACFLSHKKAWQQVLERQQPCLILEDDAILSSRSAEVMQAITAQAWPNVDYINLEVRSRKKIISKQAYRNLLHHDYQLYQLYQDRTGAAGYILFPSGAKKLLHRLQYTAPALADGFICASYALHSLQIEPALIVQEDQLHAYGLQHSQQAFTSTIGRSEQHKTVYASFADKVQFKSRRIIAQLHMAVRYVHVLPKAVKRYIRLDLKNF